jgi:polyhydroxybutyrate depolymerase
LFAAGHSNGGGMSFRLAAESANRFAAIGIVAGMMALADPRPTRPVPTLFIVGNQDPLMPLAGGEVKLPWGTKQNPPVADFLAVWANAIGCQKQPKLISDKDGLKKVEYPSAAGGPTLTVIYLEGQGHHWPGGELVLPERMVGPTRKDFDATDVIWDFFKAASGGK